MQAESLEVLEKADVAPAQARAIVRAIEIEIAGAKDTLATKHDLMLLREAMREEFAQHREATTRDLAQHRETTKHDLAQLRADLRGEISDLRVELKGDLARLEGKLEGKIHESAAGIARQMYTAILGQLAVLLGFAYFFATHIR